MLQSVGKRLDFIEENTDLRDDEVYEALKAEVFKKTAWADFQVKAALQGFE